MTGIRDHDLVVAQARMELTVNALRKGATLSSKGRASLESILQYAQEAITLDTQTHREGTD